MMEAVIHVIFLDLQKAYNDLDSPRCLGILEGYGVRPRALRLLLHYWERLRMVTRAGGYYGAPSTEREGLPRETHCCPKFVMWW